MQMVIGTQYRKPLSESQANTYIANQKITTFNDNNGRTLGKDEASYFILTSDQGFSMMRDYRNELKSLNRLYEPDYVVVVDDTLLTSVPVTAGLKKDGAIVINTNNNQYPINCFMHSELI